MVLCPSRRAKIVIIDEFREFFSSDRTEMTDLGAVFLIAATSVAALAGAFFGFCCFWPKVLK